MNIENGANMLADWLLKIRGEGRPCPTNLSQSAMRVLNCSREMANIVRRHLVTEGRLVLNPIKHIFKIDGLYFDQRIEDVTEVDKVKTLLRRKFKPVYDPRTIMKPDHVAVGDPEYLIVGAERVPYIQARAMVLA